MRYLATFIFGFISTISVGQHHQFDRARIVKINYFYEYPDSFFPFDFTRQDECNPNPLTLEFINENRLKVTLNSADCFTARRIEFSLDTSLNILDVHYSSFSDNIVENEGNTQWVDQLVLYLNQDPFKDTVRLTGRFSAIVVNSLSGGNSYDSFHGKFKVYSSDDRNLPQRVLRLNMEKELGVMNGNGIYDLPEYDARFCFGEDSLTKYLTGKVREYVSMGEIAGKFYFDFVIDKSGRVERVEISSNIGTDPSILQQIQKEVSKSCWIPAINHGTTVKSMVYPYIEIK